MLGGEFGVKFVCRSVDVVLPTDDVVARSDAIVGASDDVDDQMERSRDGRRRM
jgi:hypothetical protein